MPRPIAMLSVCLLLFPAAPANAQPLATQDGLALELDREGRVVRLATAGRTWPLADSAASGLLVRDVAKGGDFIHPAGTIARRGDTLVHSGTDAGLQLQFEVRLRAAAKTIEIAGFVQDTSGEDRAITVRFALPADAVGGSWCADLHRQEKIGPALYHDLRSIGLGATGSVSRLPWSAVSTAAGQLCLAVPPDRFVVHRLEYDGRTRSFYVDFDFGLSVATKAFPSRAEFSLVVYAADPAWGLRSALARYYAIYPQAFQRRAAKEGLWMPFTDVAKVEDPEDFQFAFHEGNNNLAYDDARGIYSFAYVSPHWAWLWMPDVKDRPTPEFVSRRLAENLKSAKPNERRLAELFVASGAHNARGDYHFSIGSAHWAPSNFGPVGWYAMAPANADPDLEQLGRGITTGGETARSIEKLLRETESRGQFLDGIYFDGVDERPLDNYCRQHFALADAPLTFDPKTRRPVMCGAFSSYKFLRRVAERMHAAGRLTMANGVPSQFPFSVSFLDAAGSELEPPIDREPVSVSWLAFARSLLGQKPLLLLYKPRLEERFDRDLSPYLIEYMNTCLLYAAEPSLFKIFSSTHPEFYHSFFERPDWYNRYRPLFIQYVPLVRTLASAGWEPVTHARVDDPRALVERFGGAANLHFVVFNAQRSGADLPVNLDIDLGGLQWPKGAAVHVADLADGSRPTSGKIDGGLRVKLVLPPRRAAVLAVRPAVAGLAAMDLAEAVRYAGVAVDRITAKLEQKLPIDFKTDTNRNGCPDGFRNYTHPAGSASYHSDAEICHSAGRSTRIVLRADARGTQSVSVPAQAGRKYLVSAWVKTDFPTPGAAHIYVQWVDRSGKAIRNEPHRSELRTTGPWSQLREEVTAPEKADKLSLVMVATHRGPGEARVWFDDPGVVELGTDGTRKTLLPMERKGMPATAQATRGRLRETARALESLGQGDLGPNLLTQAGAVTQEANALRREDVRYANVAAALEACGHRLHRAANLVHGFGMSLAGGGPVAQGDRPRFTVTITADATAIKNVAIAACASEGWKAETLGRSVELIPQGNPSPAGRVTVRATGEIALGRRLVAERQAAFEIVPACQSSVLDQGQDEAGREHRLLLAVRNLRRQNRLPITVALDAGGGLSVPWKEKAVQIEPASPWSLPIALAAGPGDKVQRREATVRVLWDGQTEAHRLLLWHVPPAANRLSNAGMEQVRNGLAVSWSPSGPGAYALDSQSKHSGSRSLHVNSSIGGRTAGASQRVVLNQTTPRDLVIRGWSQYRRPAIRSDELKTIGMTELGSLPGGDRSNNYSLYVDLHYVGGGALYGQTATFDKSVTGWQFSQIVIPAVRPIRDVVVYLLFRDQDGEAWFDDVSLAEIEPGR